MARASQQIAARVRAADVIIEVRDARIPLSSGNPLLEDMAAGKPRIVVLNKSDLASEHTRMGVQAHFAAAGVPCLFTAATAKPNAAALLRLVDRLPSKAHRFREAGVMLLVVGMSNVGKSSVINSLRNAAGGVREGRGAKTGAAPGITRSVAAFCVRRQPPTYVFDTPGVVPPRIASMDEGMKLLLCSVLPEALLPFSVQAHFLLHHWAAAGSVAYVAPLGLDAPYPGDDVTPMLERLATLRHLVLPGGAPDLEAAARLVVRAFQRGALGRHTLDRLQSPPVRVTAVAAQGSLKEHSAAVATTASAASSPVAASSSPRRVAIGTATTALGAIDGGSLR